MSKFTLAISCLTTSNLPWFMDLTFQVPTNIALYSIGSCFYHQSHPQVVIVFALAPSLHSFCSYFSTDLQQHIGHLMTWGVPFLISYHFAFSYCSWGSQGKNTEVVCHSFSCGPQSVRTFRTNTQKRCSFHYRGLECKSRKSRNAWSNRQIWPWNAEWSRAKANRVLPRECAGHSKYPLPTTQEKTLHMDITRWSTPKSDWLYSLQPNMEKL